jgi:hypothetical protein
MRTTIGLVVLIVLAAPTAWAFDTSKLGQGGSLPLDDVRPLIDKSPKLKDEVTSALAKAGKKAEEIICSGARFPREWVTLGGARVAPYECEIGDQTLTIRADVRITGRKGKAYEKITRDAMKNAETVTEDNPTWSWAKTSGEKK